jgi:hypothetical protein
VAAAAQEIGSEGSVKGTGMVGRATAMGCELSRDSVSGYFRMFIVNGYTNCGLD